MKRSLALALALCLSASPALAAWSVTHKTANVNTANHSLATANITIAANHIIWVSGTARMAAGTDVIGVTDQAGDTYTVYQCPQSAGSTTVTYQAYTVTTGLTTQKVTVADDVAATATALGISVEDITGGLTSSVEDSAVRACAGNGSNTTTPSVTSGVPTQTGELLISSYGSGTSTTSFTLTEDAAWTDANGTVGGSTSLIFTPAYLDEGAAAAAKTRAPTTTARTYAMNVMGLFLNGGGPPASSLCLLNLLGVGKC